MVVLPYPAFCTLVTIDLKMTGEMHKNILQNNLTKDYEDELPQAWMFQHDNNLNHSSRAVKAWFAEEKNKGS